MRSFTDIERTFGGQPRALGAELSRIDVAKGQERLFLDQLPELLRALSDSARVASITASNAIENVIVSTDRAQRIAEGSPRFRDRNEKEFAGYRDAIDYVMRFDGYESLSVPLLLHLHRLLFQHVDGRGGHLKSDQNLIVSYESGRREVIFTPPDEHATPMMLAELLDRYGEAKREGRTHPLVLIAALILDLLAIHPVADGNGRLARLVTTYELLAAGYGVARYVSVEQRIFEAKNAYYQSLYESQRRWHAGQHTIWPWTTFLVRILAGAYEALEERVAAGALNTGSKQERVREYILHQAPSEFRTRDLHRALPGVSAATIRLVLIELRDAGRISSRGTGAGARWRRREPPREPCAGSETRNPALSRASPRSG
jgi:Fic family protein